MSKTLLVTSQEVADHFGVTRRTFHNWLKRGGPTHRDEHARKGYLYDLREWKAWRAGLLPQPRNFTHGTIYGYRTGCRCTKCRRANADYIGRYRERRRARAVGK